HTGNIRNYHRLVPAHIQVMPFPRAVIIVWTHRTALGAGQLGTILTNHLRLDLLLLMGKRHF
ncbi:MAG: hypothetical protein OXI38_06835, partial [Bacteroidota bacterium]|nr:hypothetical protein [Bacteroidota bacterium]